MADKRTPRKRDWGSGEEVVKNEERHLEKSAEKEKKGKGKLKDKDKEETKREIEVQIQSENKEKGKPKEQEEEDQGEEKEIQEKEKEIRAPHLRQAFQKALSSALEACSNDKFLACFPTVKPVVVTDAHQQLISRLRDNCEKEFEVILDSKQIVEKLNSLDRLNRDQQASNDNDNDNDNESGNQNIGNIHSTTLTNKSPEEIMRARGMPLKKQRIEDLKSELQGLEEENEKLHQSILGLRKRQVAAAEGFSKKRKLIEGAANASAKLEIEQIWSMLQGLSSDLPSSSSSSSSSTTSSTTTTTTTTKASFDVFKVPAEPRKSVSKTSSASSKKNLLDDDFVGN